MIRNLTTTRVATRSGMTLVELLVAVAVAALLILGLVTIASATSAASLLQRNQAQVQDNVRFAMNLVSGAVRQAGYSPEPWDDHFGRDAVTAESVDGGPGASDRLALRGWSDRNCFENLNPDRDAGGQPLYYLRESVFDLTGDRNLAHRCRYGPSPAELITQIPRQGVVPGIESFQVLYGEDADRDGDVERWVKAGEWSHPDHVLGVRIGMLVTSENAVLEPAAEEYELLGVAVACPPDGKLRRVFEFATAIRGRTR